MNIGIFIYENAEVLDFCGPFEVFSTAKRLSKTDSITQVFLIAEKAHPVMARGGLSVNSHYTLNNHPEIDVLVVVGGVHTAELKKTTVLNWVSHMSQEAKIVASVCTGAFILAEAGLLRGKRVTTHWEDIEALRNAYTDLTVVEHQRWIDEGKYVTSGGISAGIDMSLHLVSRLEDLALAENTARQMEFDWQKIGSPQPM